MGYEPYKTDNFLKIMQWAYDKGWYLHCLDLITVKMQGAFEGFSGRASETWEHRFIVSNCEIPELGIKSHEAVGETLDNACYWLLDQINKDKEST